MSSEPEAAQDSIQLHFCQKCGISIPQSEIDSGRARPAPGGYICGDNCYATGEYRGEPGNRLGPDEVGPPVDMRRDGGVRLLVAIALLYVVGATTFLLIREVNRKPPVIDLTGIPSTRAFNALDAKIEALDEHDRALLASVQGTAAVHREDLRKLQERLASVEQFVQEEAKKSDLELERLNKAVLETLNNTVGLRRDLPGILKELERERDARTGTESARNPGPVSTQPQPNAGTGVTPEPVQPVKSAAELERDREVRQYIAILDDKKAEGQERYDAAVNLGDLRHKDAVQPLVRALDQGGDTLLKRAAAWALGRHGKLAVPAIPSLIKQIGGKEAYVGYTCVDTLKRITKDALGAEASVGEPFDPTMNQKQRRKVQRAWEAWWSKNQKLLGA